jgi:hypothetical protein
MGVLSDVHRVSVGSSDVVVTVNSGIVHATWTLWVDDHVVDSASASGDFRLRGALADGSDVVALIHQGMLGPTEVIVLNDSREVARFTGFVA